MSAATIEDLLRELAPQVLGALVRRHGQFEACEDATQEALLAAATRWPSDGVPANPRGWLITVASRRLLDIWRSEIARERREATAVALDGRAGGPAAQTDDTLALLFMCCHPALTPPSQLALTLRAVGGLTTAEIAAAFLVPETTMGQRISRARQAVQRAGARFGLPAHDELPARLAVVLQVLYLMFNEGYTASGGDVPIRGELTAEAIRLARVLHAALPGQAEVAGLLALLLLTEARRPARTDDDGWLVPLDRQDRSTWDAGMVAEGIELLGRTLGTAPAGPYQLQAAIAAVHDEAAAAGQTDWPQILALYDVLEAVAPSPVVTLNRAVAVAMVHGPLAGLAVLGTLAADERLTHSHRLVAVRAYLQELAGRRDEARQDYLAASRGTLNTAERRYLRIKAAELSA